MSWSGQKRPTKAVMYQALLSDQDDGWRDIARRFALSDIPAQDIEWRMEGEAGSLLAFDVPPPRKKGGEFFVPRAF